MSPNQPTRCDSPLWAEIRSPRPLPRLTVAQLYALSTDGSHQTARAAEDELARRRAAREATFTPDEKGAA